MLDDPGGDVNFLLRAGSAASMITTELTRAAAAPAGEVVAIPTETVYGLAACVLSRPLY